MKTVILLLILVVFSCSKKDEKSTSNSLKNEIKADVALIKSIKTTVIFRDLDRYSASESFIEYDSTGKVTATDRSFTEKDSRVKVIVTDNNSGKIVNRSISYNDSIEIFEEYKYKNDTLLINKKTSYPQRDISYLTTYEYDNSSTLQKIKEFSIYNNYKQLISTTTFNKNNEVSEISTTDFRGECDSIVSKTKFGYSYDKNGNWIIKKPIDEGSDFPIELREITYY